jgi:hypothetical protein
MKGMIHVKRALLLISMMLLSVSLLLGCQSKNGESVPKNSNNTNQNGSAKVDDNSKSAEIRAVYLIGNYDEELYKLQNKSREEGKIYYHFIHNQNDLSSITSKYSLVKEGTNESYKLKEDFFNEKMIIAVYPGQGSSSVHYTVTDVNEKGAWNIEIEKLVPEVQTEDMINRVIFVEMRKEFFEKYQKVNINITEKKYTSNVFNKNELYMDDLALGGVKVNMSKKDVLKAMGKPDRIDNDVKGFHERLSYGNNTTIMLTDNKVRFIETLSTKYSTPRGLIVGDSKDELIRQYGEPSNVLEDKATGNQIFDYDLSGEYYLFHAEVKNNKIIRLQVNLVE